MHLCGLCWKCFLWEIWHDLPDDDQWLGSFSTKNTPILLDTITNGLGYLEVMERLSLTILGSRLDSFLLTHHHDISTWRDVVPYSAHSCGYELQLMLAWLQTLTSYCNDMLHITLQALLYLSLDNWSFNAPRLLHDSASFTQVSFTFPMTIVLKTLWGPRYNIRYFNP